MEWVGCIHCEKFQNDVRAQTCALIAPVQPILHRVSCSNEIFQMHPNTMRRTQTWVSGPMGWINSVHCEKFWCDFMARTCSLIAPVQLVLHHVSCSNEIFPNTPKHYETHINMGLQSNGVDWVRSLRKILKRLHITNLSINCTTSIRFATSFV